MPDFYICRENNNEHVIHESACLDFKRFRGQSRGPFATLRAAEDAHKMTDFFGNNPCWTHGCAREDSPLVRSLQEHFEKYSR
jgi:hypothetical protein